MGKEDALVPQSKKDLPDEKDEQNIPEREQQPSGKARQPSQAPFNVRCCQSERRRSQA